MVAVLERIPIGCPTSGPKKSFKSIFWILRFEVIIPGSGLALEEGQQVAGGGFGLFLGEKVAARQGLARYRPIGPFPPAGKDIELPFHHAVQAPEYVHRAADFPLDIRLVMKQIDRGGGAVVLAAGVNDIRILETALIVFERFRRENLKPAFTPWPSFWCR